MFAKYFLKGHRFFLQNSVREAGPFTILLAYLSLICGLPLWAQLPLEPGEAVATCFSEFTGRYDETSPINGNGFVLALADLRDPVGRGAGFGANWSMTLFHNEAGQPWNANNLGQVFGITLDDAFPANIYVTATSTYGRFLTGSGAEDPALWGTGGAGGVYRIDGVNGSITVFCTLPNSGPALGDICYDAANKQFFVSNFEDGLIYRLDKLGNILSTYDHGLTNGLTADDGVPMDPLYASNPVNQSRTSGFTALGRRVWAVQVYNGRLYYSVWGSDSGRQVAPNEIWSVALNAADGRFLPGQTVLEITPPNFSSGNFSNPVSDIAFSSTGSMLIGERTMNQDVGEFQVSSTSGHRARVMEYNGSHPANWGTPTMVNIGAANSNCEGGVSYGPDIFNDMSGTGPACDGSILATGEQLTGRSETSDFTYGIQISPPGGPATNPPWNDSYAIDLDGLVSRSDASIKSRIGDVEALQSNCFPDLACMDILEQVLMCKGRNGDSYEYELQISFLNNSPFLTPATQVTIEPKTSFLGGLPLTLSLVPVGPGDVSGVVTIPFTVTGNRTGESICLDLRFEANDGRGCPIWCCPKQTLCLDLPECQLPCFSARPVYNCRTGRIDITINNDGSFDAHRVQLTSETAGVSLSPEIFNLSPPLPPGGTRIISVQLNPSIPTTRPQVLASLHGPVDPQTGVAECCFLDLTLPGLLDLACNFNGRGCVFDDRNRNGFQDEGERGLAGWTIYAEGPQGNVASMLTDQEGAFRFETFEPGSHFFTLRMNEGFELLTETCTHRVEFSGNNEPNILKWGVGPIRP